MFSQQNNFFQHSFRVFQVGQCGLAKTILVSAEATCQTLRETDYICSSQKSLSETVHAYSHSSYVVRVLYTHTHARSICIFASIYLWLCCQSIYLYIYLSICPSIWLSVYPYIMSRANLIIYIFQMHSAV